MTTNDAHALLASLLNEIAPEIDIRDYGDDALLRADLDLDSMDFLNLVTALHEETGIEVPERDYARIETVGGFVQYIEAAQGRQVEGSARR